MKLGWKQKPLAEIAKVGAGDPAPQDKSLFQGGTYPFFRTADAGRVGIGILEQAADSLNEAGIRGLKRYPKGTILLPKSGASTFLNHRVILGTDGFVASHLATVVGNEDLVNIRFLFHFLTTISAQDLIPDNKYPSLKLSDIRRIPVPIPPLAEQQGIAAILDEALGGINSMIANTQENIANAREVFESSLHQTYGRQDPSWHVSKIEDQVRLIDYRGRTPKKTEAGLRLITAKNVRPGVLNLHPQEFVNPSIYDTWMTRGIPRRGDVLFTTEAPLANVAQLDTDDRVVFAQRVIIMQSSTESLDSTFLKYMLMSPGVQRELERQATGATAKGIKASRLKKIQIRFPDLSEQQAIAQNLTQIEATTQDLEKVCSDKLTELHALKQAVVRKAFAGELTAIAARALSVA